MKFIIAKKIFVLHDFTDKLMSNKKIDLLAEA